MLAAFFRKDQEAQGDDRQAAGCLRRVSEAKSSDGSLCGCVLADLLPLIWHREHHARPVVEQKNSRCKTSYFHPVLCVFCFCYNHRVRHIDKVLAI